jgi:hypothetical protein
MGRDTTEAATGLHLLDTHYRVHPSTGPSGRRSASPAPGAPLNLAVVDHIDRCVAEVVDHARADAGDTLAPLPPRVRDIYDWWHQHTEHAAPEVRLRRDIVIHRQRLEHAIALGETGVIRTYPCPGCATWGLIWQDHLHRALCPNIRCRDRNGMARSWSLARLATQAETEQENRASRAT